MADLTGRLMMVARLGELTRLYVEKRNAADPTSQMWHEANMDAITASNMVTHAVSEIVAEVNDLRDELSRLRATVAQ